MAGFRIINKTVRQLLGELDRARSTYRRKGDTLRFACYESIIDHIRKNAWDKWYNIDCASDHVIYTRDQYFRERDYKTVAVYNEILDIVKKYQSA